MRRGSPRRRQDSGYPIQSNILVGEQVFRDMERAWLDNLRLRLDARLIRVLLSGDQGGGDARGRQSAALDPVARGAGYDHCGILVDLHVDDQDRATGEMAGLPDLHDLPFGSPAVLSLKARLADEVRRHLTAPGQVHTHVHDGPQDWTGEANLEMQMAPYGINACVLQAVA